MELVDAAIERIEALDPALNAVIHPRFDVAREAARGGSLPDGPLRGVPIVVKDTAQVAGDPVRMGMRPLLDADWRAVIDDAYVAKLLDAGCVIVGRTNMPELADQATTEPVLHGPTANPWDPTRSAGGSSGGSAAAVAAGMVAVGHGNDGGGSIRIPASVCGLVGLKASRGRVSAGPLPEAPGTTRVEGVLTRSVRDTAALLDVIAGSMPGDPHPMPDPDRPFVEELSGSPGRLRVVVMPQPPAGLTTDPVCVTAVERAATALEAAGHVVVDEAPRLPSWERMRAGLLDNWAVGTASLVRGLGAAIGRPIAPDELEPTNAALLRRADMVSALDEAGRRTWWASIGRSLGQWWSEGHDLLLTPTVRTPTPRLGEVVVATADPLTGWIDMWDWIPFTPLWNILGNPAISLPLHDHDGLPVGVQLIADCGREDLLLQVAGQLEEALPWQDRRPPVPA